MGQVVVVGLDIAKSVFQVHGVDRAGGVVVRRRLRRSRGAAVFRDGRALSDRHRGGVPPGTIGCESCARSGTMSG